MARKPRKLQQHLVFQSQVDGKKTWTKPARPERGTRWHWVMDAVGRVFSFPLIARTVNRGGAQGLRLEAERLRRAADKGVRVPQVLELTEDRLVTTDTGVSLEYHIRTEPDLQKRFELLSHAARALADMHGKGVVHGRPYLRDLTWDGERIGFVDLEEDPLAVMPFAAAQARDIWLFINHSANAVLQEPDRHRAVSFLLDVFKIYEASAPKDYEAELRRLVKIVRGLRRSVGVIVARDNAPRDMRRAVLANMALERHFFSP